MLPCDSDGLPLVDSFDLSLEGIEECFRSQEISKFPYVFMDQCILQLLPGYDSLMLQVYVVTYIK